VVGVFHFLLSRPDTVPAADRLGTEWVPSIDSFDDGRLHWRNGEPGGDASAVSGAERWGLERGELVVAPSPKRDYWSRTFYSPLLIKSDAQTLLATVPGSVEATLTTAFTLTPVAQFDQAGIMIVVDDGLDSTWVKAGIEYTDGVPRLSCVVTNDGYSDWSTQKWLSWDAHHKSTSVRIRVSKVEPGPDQGPAIVMEAAEYHDGDDVDDPADWFQVRIASLRSRGHPWEMGFFSISPVAQLGSQVRFHHMKLGQKVQLTHNSDSGTV
jgi:regulation of enolase protein 1 (concanavalin A-like superfamily)